MGEIVSIISTVGFPIACCLIMFYWCMKQEERHKAETDKLAEALNNNTLALTKLSERMGANVNDK